MLDVVWLEFRPCIVPRGVAVCNIMGRISSVVLRDVAGLDIIDGAFRCATGGQRARRHMRTLLSCRGTLPGSMALTESFAVLDVVWLEFRPFIVLLGVAVCNIIGRISSVVLRDVAGLDIIDGAFRDVPGRDVISGVSRGMANCLGVFRVSRGSTSSAASFAVPDVAVLVLSTFRPAAGRRRVQRHRWSLLPRAAGRHNVCRHRRSVFRTVVDRRGPRLSAV